MGFRGDGHQRQYLDQARRPLKNYSGHVLLSDDTAVKVSQSLVFNKGRLYSMTRNSPVIVEAPERLGTDLLGWASLMVEEGLPHGLGPDRRTS